jgi:hypothetical protein
MFDKVTAQDRANKGNVGLPDTPNMTANELQERMDSLPNLGIDKLNELIDGLNAETAAGNIGMVVPNGVTTTQTTIQAVINAIVLDWSLNTANRHSHSNKDTLDTITSTMLDNYSALVTLFTGIESIAQAVSNNNSAIPTSKAVKDFVDAYDIKSKVLAVAYPVGVIYSTKGTAPGTLFGGTWSVLDTDTQGVTRYLRTA